MKFAKGNDSRRNVRGRPKGSKNRRNVILDALQDVYGPGGEKQFWTEVAKVAMDGDTSAMNLIANRLIPTLKSQAPCIEIDLPEGDTVAVAQSLLVSAANGKLSPDQLGSLMSSLATALKIEEATLLEERVATLEAKQ